MTKPKVEIVKAETPYQPTLEEIFIGQMEINPLVFGLYMFPHHFRDQSPQFHLDIIKNVMKRRKLVVAAPRESAKAQSLDSKVLTPDGWVRIGDLRVGDLLITPDGSLTSISQLHPISQMDLYRVTFRGGASTLCNLDHLWKVYCPSNTKNRPLIKPLRDILKNYQADRYDKRFDTHFTECRYYIDLPKPIQFPEEELSIDPYTLGVWLGDGHSAGSRITTADDELIKYIPYECSKNKAKYNWCVRGLKQKLRKLGVLNNKHIPQEYLFSSIEQREALLQGLIDTDGHIPEKKSAIEFTNTNRDIIDGFAHLVRSLGGKASIRDNFTTCNEKRFHSWRVYALLPDSITPCKLTRKLDNWGGKCNLKLYIEDIKYEKTEEGRCITVANPDGLYITDDFLITHNSTLLAFLYCFHCVIFKKKRFVVIVGSTEAKAKQRLDAMKAELKDNAKLKDFARLKLVKDSEIESVFQHPDGFRTMVLCRGREQIPKIRGDLWQGYRPDLILCDDIEDDEMVKNRDQRIQLKRYFDDALIPAGDFKTCSFIVIGTVLHDDSQLNKLLSPTEYRDWYKIKYYALSHDRTVSLWADKWTVADLLKIEKEDPIKFAKEYQNDPVSGENARFRKEDFVYWRERTGCYELLNPDNSLKGRGVFTDCRAAIGCDLAWSTRKEADYSVLMGGLLTPESDILVYKYIAEKGMRPDRFCELLFAMVAKLEGITKGSVPVGFERAMLEQVSKWLIKQESRKQNKFIIMKDIKWESDKITRIETTLQPRYANQVIYHKHNMGDLEHEILRFPYGVTDDRIDALHGMVKLLKNPKNKKADPDYDDEFEWYRKKAIEQTKPQKRKFVFGQRKLRGWELPAKEAYR